MRLLYLAELVARGGTLDEQADELCRWASASLGEIAAWSPFDSP